VAVTPLIRQKGLLGNEASAARLKEDQQRSKRRGEERRGEAGITTLNPQKTKTQTMSSLGFC